MDAPPNPPDGRTEARSLGVSAKDQLPSSPPASARDSAADRIFHEAQPREGSNTRRSTKVNPGLWRCRRCGRRFANQNQSHSCGRWDLQHHFRDKPREIRELYDAFVAAVRGIGRVIIVPEKTRIAFQVRMSFAQITPRRKWLDGHVILSHVALSRHFRAVQTISPKNHVHTFRITTRSDLDSEMISLLRAAYAVGEQKHLRHRQGGRTLAG